MIGLLETKVKESNVDKVARKMIPGWCWQRNFEHNTKDHRWLAWKPSLYNAQVLMKTDQLKHYYATQLHIHKKFFVYGMNQATEGVPTV